ncbi:MAG: DNA polymerase III subunit gamma/tau [Chloroflexi bacterium]|nr:DNA polymerase III subunit gamma/tau [Chloroflexota bacterium]
MSPEVLYRKWRPHTFAELAGQEAVSRTLTNAVKAGRVAHAYLFSGPRGTGKTTTGRLLAKAVNCTNPKDGDPCDECDSCQAYRAGRALDLVELDAASNRGIDEIRSLRERANFAPSGGQDAYKVYLIDEVHMLTEPAFNALLKTLEEPPAHVIFALATTEAHKVPSTVVSRCQRFDFRRISVNDVKGRLRVVADGEEFEVPDDALDKIARVATGSLRDAINLLEQMVDSYGTKLTLENVIEGLGEIIDERSGELATHALRGNLKEGLTLISEVRDDGSDLRQFQRQVIAFLRGSLLAKAGVEPEDGWSDKQKEARQQLVADLAPERIVATLKAFGEADLRADPLSPLPLELALASCVLMQEAGSAAAAAPAVGAAAPPPKAKASIAKTPPMSAPQAAPTKADAPKAESPMAKTPPAPAPKPTPTKADAPKPEPAEAKSSAASSTPVPADAAPEPTPTSNGASDTRPASAQLEEARAKWPDIYKRTREIQYRAGALLNSGCAIIDASDDEVTFGFRHAMLLDRMEGDGGENLRALQQAVDDVLGPGRAVKCVLDPNVEAQRTSRGGHLVRAVEELGAEPLSQDSQGG